MFDTVTYTVFRGRQDLRRTSAADGKFLCHTRYVG